jgi:hypothetical protein
LNHRTGGGLPQEILGLCGDPDVRALVGVLAKDRTFTKGIIVTTSNFTAECRRFAEGQGNLELIEGCQPLWLLQQYNVPLACFARSNKVSAQHPATSQNPTVARPIAFTRTR